MSKPGRDGFATSGWDWEGDRTPVESVRVVWVGYSGPASSVFINFSFFVYAPNSRAGSFFSI